ncbi:MAG: MFS transporter [Bryobacteraceae bacterium]
MSPALQLERSRSPRNGLIVLFAINILNFYDRQVLGALAEPLRKEFHLNDTEIGWLSTSFTLVYALIGVPIGRLADSHSRKKLLAAGVVLWSLLTASGALATNYLSLLLCRLGVGVGEAVCAPVGTSWIGDLFPAEKRARALSLFMLGVPIGGALSYFLSGPTAQAFGWRMALALAAAPAILLVPALLMVSEPQRGASEKRGVPAAGKQSPWTVLRIPTLWWIIASGAVLNFMLYALGAFMAAFFSRVHGLTVAESGIATGITYGTGGLLGGLLAGAWGDRIVHRRKDGRMLSAAVTALLAMPFSYFAILQPAGSAPLALGLMALTYALCNSYYGFVYSSIQDIVPPALRGTTMAIYFMIMYLGGASFGPLITGNLSDRLARQAAHAAGSPVITEAARAAGLQQAMLIIPFLSVVLAAVLYAGSRTIGKDIENRV